MTTRRFITIFALISFLITSQIVQATSTGREPIEPTDRSGSQLTIPLNPGVVWDTSTQAVNADYAQPGQRITYTLQISNTGDTPALDAIVTDTLDSQVTFAVADHGGVFNTDRVIWSGLTVTNGTMLTLTVAITISSPLNDLTPIVNQASVSGELSSFELPIVTTTVYNPPLADFDATPTLGTAPLDVTFTNHSQHATSYLWSFGDSFTDIATLFSDNFNDGQLGSAWTTWNGTWSEASGVLAQTSTGYSDPRKAIISNSGVTFPSNHMITTKVRVDSWIDGACARAGVSLLTNSNGLGYNLMFNGDQSTVQFLDDYVTYGPSYTYTWSTETWYWFKLKTEDGTLYGKVWQDGTTEPATWPYSWTRSGRTGYPALNGGSASPNAWCTGNSTVSFDEVTVTAATSTPDIHHTYTANGVYTVSLRVANPVGTDALTRTSYITVYQPALASFTASPTIGLWPLTVTFTNTSSAADQFLWNYGDGVTGTVTATTHPHVYASPGSYTVTLTAIGPYNSHTLTQSDYIHVYALPSANFTAAPNIGEVPLLVTFTNYSLHASSYEWDFGDGHVAYAPGFSDTFDGDELSSAWTTYSGTWSVANGVLAQTSLEFAVVRKAIISNSGMTFPTNLTITAKVRVDSWTDGDSRAGVGLFTNPMDGRGYNLVFHSNHSTVQFLDDEVTWGPSYTFAWTDHTWYWFKLKMENGRLWGKIWEDGTTEPAPWPYSWARSGRSGYPALNGGASTYFGGNSTVSFDEVAVTAATSTPDIRHTYTANGVYTVSLRVANPIGTDALTRTSYITVYQPALASFTASPTIGLWPLTVTFTNTSSAADQFLWNYGDGVTGTVTATTHPHVYASPGSYTVTLTAIGPYNSHTLTQSDYIHVYALPSANFTAAPNIGEVPLLVTFTNYSLHASSYEWDFGDGSISYAAAPSHYYFDKGIYTVRLTASNPVGEDTLVRIAYIIVSGPLSPRVYLPIVIHGEP